MDFLTVGITRPEISVSLDQETGRIINLLQSGAIDFFHIRKPGGNSSDYRKLVEKIPAALHPRIVIDDHYHLAGLYNLGGIHLKSSDLAGSDRELMEKRNAFFTRSCHSIEEISCLKSDDYKYVFLSPIFDSISKKGYHSKFDLNEKGFGNEFVPHNVLALGGVEPEKFKKLFESKFVGAALLGYLWQTKPDESSLIRELLKYKNQL